MGQRMQLMRKACRERVQHLRDAKVTANRVVRSHLDPEAREAQRARDEEARAKRLAATISKEVCVGLAISVRSVHV